MSAITPSHPSPPDAELAERIHAGEEQAFELLFRRHSEALLRFATSVIGDLAAAEDIVQDVFAWVWTHRVGWAPPGGVLPYLLTATRNRALNRVRDARLQDARVRDVLPTLMAGQSAPLPESIPGMAPALVTPDVAVEARERQARVWSAIATLPEHRRTILILRWEHDLGWDEIASVVGLTVAAAKMQHSRALAMLRERLPRAFE